MFFELWLILVNILAKWKFAFEDFLFLFFLLDNYFILWFTYSNPSLYPNIIILFKTVLDFSPSQMPIFWNCNLFSKIVFFTTLSSSALFVVGLYFIFGWFVFFRNLLSTLHLIGLLLAWFVMLRIRSCFCFFFVPIIILLQLFNIFRHFLTGVYHFRIGIRTFFHF